jgi:hypothetical protein
MPTKDSHRQLFEALAKKKVKDSISSQNYVDDAKKKQIETKEYIERVLSQTQAIRSESQKKVAYWE